MRKGLLIHPSELSVKWIDRLADAGIDTLGLHPEGGRDAHLSLERLLALLETAEYRRLLDYAADRGLAIEYEFHAASWLLPRELFASHPEYFRMDETGSRTARLNFCRTNEAALEIVAERAAMLAKKLYRSTPNYYFWLDDARSAPCCCERCRELSAADSQLLVMNRILARLREDNPDAKLAYLAYMDTLTPPTQVKPAEGIFVEYAPIDRIKMKPVPPASEDDAAIRPLVGYFGAQNAKVLEYWYDNSLFSGWKKPPVKFVPDADLVRGDCAYYQRAGFSYITSFACFLGEDYEELHGDVDVSAFGKI